MPGCKTMPTVAELATPTRIQAVVSLGAYKAGAYAIAAGQRDAIQRTRNAMKVIEDSNVADMTAVIAALKAGGISFLETSDGTLAIGAVLVFSDLWDGTAGKILSGEHVRAVIIGCVRGFDVALAERAKANAFRSNTELATLVDDVIETRSKKH